MTSIGRDAFWGCSSLKEVTIIGKIKNIDGGAFYQCNALKTIILPDSMTSIGHFPRTGSAGDMAFMGCSSLENIYYGGSVDEWLQIEGLYDLMNYSSPRKKLYINGELLTEAVINTATAINRDAFNGCTSLTSAIIGDSVTRIGSGAFEGCSSFKSITIGSGVTSISGNAFKNCTLLEFNKYDNGLYLGNETNKYLALIKPKTQGIKSITINDECKIIVDGAFNGCSSLVFNQYDTGLYLGNETNKYLALIKPKTQEIRNITINAECKIIAGGVFGGCESLSNITLPDRVKGIGDRAFYGCRSLTSVTIPDSVTSIGGSAFYNCSSLMSITIGDSVTSIGPSVFAYCKSLKTINYKGSKEQWDAISKGTSWNYGTGSYTINYNYVEN